MAEKQVLSFIHLSDIHFNKNSGDAYDIDKELRTAMLNDIATHVKENIGDVNGILVCGDIAFSGKKEEYEIAKHFLNDVATKLDVDLSNIYCVPGNHDVDQQIIKNSKILECVQNYVSYVDDNNPDRVDMEIRSIQNDPLVKGILYSPILQYNEAVAEMACAHTCDCPQWVSEMKLDSKHTLKIIGINSVMTSSFKDHIDDMGNRIQNGERKMVVDKVQIPTPEENVIFMSLCHHPPECWGNQNLIERMNSRVKIQLYGHMHKQRLLKHESYVRINSGALQPERGDDWMPYYNWIQIYLEEQNLVIKIFPRVFNDAEGIFNADFLACDNSKIYKLFKINLNEREKVMSDCIECAERKRATNIYTKEIVYRFMTISDANKKMVINKFSLIDFDVRQDIAVLLDQLHINQIEKEFLEELRRIR